MAIAHMRKPIIWSAVVISLAIADILITRHALLLGASEVNPIMQLLPFEGMIVCKMAGMAVIIGISLRFRVLASLILTAGITGGAVVFNIIEVGSRSSL